MRSFQYTGASEAQDVSASRTADQQAAELSPQDLRELARELHVLRISFDDTLLTDQQMADMEHLAMAQVLAQTGDADAVRSCLSSVGKWTVKAATDVEAWLAAAAITAQGR